MRISRNYTVDDWRKLHFADEAEWQIAVDMLRDRLETRYLEHIRSLLLRQTSGFVVLALDSALIETMEQFRRGKNKTPTRHGGKYFESFLTETEFGVHFDTAMARLFYKTIRCGLLHQSEAGSTSRVKRGGDIPLVAYTVAHDGVVVNTKKFHDLLEHVITLYLTELREPTAIELRARFRRKMNFICRIEGEDAEDSDAA